MYKYIVLITLCICLLSSCGHNVDEKVEIESKINIESRNDAQEHITNKYFYNTSNKCLEALATNENPNEEPTGNIRYDNSWFESKTVNVTINKLEKIGNGEIYKLKIILPSDFLSYLEPERLNIYFYVTEDKIYRLLSYVFTDNGLISFYDDDDMLLRELDTEEKLIANGYIVFQEDEYSYFESNVQDENDENESPLHGSHYSIKKNEKQTTGAYRYIKYNGESDFYEWFIWEEYKGLIEYGSGYRNESDVLYLKDISVTSPYNWL